jgi:diadenylate cyclase
VQGFSDLLWILRRIDALAVVDILLVTLVFYALLRLIRGTQAVQLLRGIIFLVLVVVVVSGLFRLTAFNWLLRSAIPALLVALPVIFQPELRRALERLGRAGGIIIWPQKETEPDKTIAAITEACADLSKQRWGALIVLERETGLQQYVDTGVMINSDLSADLLLTVFYPNTALHDGAVIVREGRIAAAACVLPLAKTLVSKGHIGTRHRAAIGATEETDAISIVVSEETGIVSIARGGRMVRHLDQRRLRRILTALLRPPAPRRSVPDWLKDQVENRFRRESSPHD